MYEDIKNIIGKALGFIFWLIVLSFVIGFSIGNYLGVKSSIQYPQTFHAQILPGYMIMRYNYPEIEFKEFKSTEHK